MDELQFQVVIDPKLERICEGVVAFGDFEVRDGDPIGVAYSGDHPLLTFYQELVAGRAFPLTFATRSARSIETVAAVALFLHRDLAILPATSSFVFAVDLVARMGYGGLAHVDHHLGMFLHFLESYLPTDLGRTTEQDRLKTVVGWIRDYLVDGTFGALTRDPPMPRVLDVGSDGFVVAETASSKDMRLAWVELFCQGFLRGVLFNPNPKAGTHRVLAARKSRYLSLDLRRAAEALNEAEKAMGEPPEWEADDLWMSSPPGGTQLPPTAVINVLLRV